ncbi:MAG: SdpI family protein [Oscillospiraceae bacterium]|nr:SdpI family protein [Oscillospiraceae bacterium]
MKKNKFMIISFVLSILNLIASLIYIPTLPDMVPTHFDANFQVDAIGSKWIMLIPAFLPLLISLGILLELKLRKNDYPNRKPLQITMLIITIFFICVNFFLFWTMQGEAVIGAKMEHMPHLGYLLILAFGLLFIAMGNFFPTITQNKTLGIKISWTLNNEQCWKLTHRFGGKVFVIAGFLLVLIDIIAMIAGLSPEWLLIIFMVILTAVFVITSVYAYQHRND